MWNTVFLGVTFWWLHMTRDAENAFALPPRDTYGKYMYKAHKEIILKPVCWADNLTTIKRTEVQAIHLITSSLITNLLSLWLEKRNITFSTV